MNLFQQGTFALHSGASSVWKIDCDALTDADLETLAVLIAERVGEFSAVEGVPRGGDALACCLEKYRSADGPLLLVDDVCTTGGSLEKQRNGREAVGYVIFSRGGLPKWAKALFSLDDS